MTGRQPKILIVDDEVAIVVGIAEYLRRREFDVTTSLTLCDGRRAIESAAERPDIVLVDVRLPDGDGLDLVFQINRENSLLPRPRVILMTGLLDLSRAEAGGAEAVLLKPFGLKALLALIQSPPGDTASLAA